MTDSQLDEAQLTAARRVLSERTVDGKKLSAADLARMVEEEFDQSGLGDLLEKMADEDDGKDENLMPTLSDQVANSPISFDIWEIDEPEFLDNTEVKFRVLVHPVNMALGTDGKNDHLARQAIDMLAAWALRKLLWATVKVSFWTALVIVMRRFIKKDFRLTGGHHVEL